MLLRFPFALIALAALTLTAAAEDKNDPAVSKESAGNVSANPKEKPTRPAPPRVLFITAKDSERCAKELARLQRPGGDFETMQSLGWKIGFGPENHLQIVDREAVASLVERLHVNNFPTVACVEGDAIVRSFQSGCTTPLDSWTFGWLAKGIDERPTEPVLEAALVATTGHYPLRGNHWTIDDEWAPSRERVISHLRGAHGSQVDAGYAIETWSYEELRSLHDDLHERYGGGGIGHYRAQAVTRSAGQKSAGHKISGR